MNAKFAVITHDMHTQIAASAGVKNKLRLVLTALVLLLCGAAFWMIGGALRMLGFLAIIVGLCMLVYPLAARTNRKRAEDTLKSVIYTFGDEKISIRDGEEEFEAYDSFEKITEDSERFMLYMRRTYALILPKQDFTHGNPDEFAAFISEKTGLEVKRVKG